MLACYSEDDPSLRDHYIGLKKGALSFCSCSYTDLSSPSDLATCRQCQLTWQWENGEPMQFLNWVGDSVKEPGEYLATHACGLLTPVGWRGTNCREVFKYICEREVCAVMIFIQVLSAVRCSAKDPTYYRYRHHASKCKLAGVLP